MGVRKKERGRRFLGIVACDTTAVQQVGDTLPRCELLVFWPLFAAVESGRDGEVTPSQRPLVTAPLCALHPPLDNDEKVPFLPSFLSRHTGRVGNLCCGVLSWLHQGVGHLSARISNAYKTTAPGFAILPTLSRPA